MKSFTQIFSQKVPNNVTFGEVAGLIYVSLGVGNILGVIPPLIYATNITGIIAGSIIAIAVGVYLMVHYRQGSKSK